MPVQLISRGVAQGRISPTIGNHSVTVYRRARDGSFVPLPFGNVFAVGEQVRVVISGMMNLAYLRPILTVRGTGAAFPIFTATGDLLGSEWQVNLPALPLGRYYVEVVARTGLGNMATHIASTYVKVVPAAEAPQPEAGLPDTSKGNPFNDIFKGLGNVKGVAIAVAVIVGLVVLGPSLARLIPKGKG